jgi:predicted CXXCH cytochrome family protein
VILLAFACAPDPVDDPLGADWPALPAEVVSRQTLDAVYPTDVLARLDGSVWVLDGYRGAIVALPKDGGASTRLGEDQEWGRPVRLAHADRGGAWLSDPAGRLVEIDSEAKTVRTLDLAAADAPAPWVVPSGPVAVVEDGDALVVSDRHGQIVWLDRETGAPRARITHDPTGARIGTVTDLARARSGAILAADAVGGRVHEVTPDGEWRSFGRYGLWIGALKQPKAVLPFEGGWLVADSALRAVQLFATDGTARGLLTVDGVRLELGHPIALERTIGGDLLVLDAATATLWTLRVDRAALEGLLDEAPARWKRTPLVEDYAGVAGLDGRDCLQCHDGLVNDSRQVWDAGLGHHPIEEPLEDPLPAFFTLDEQGRITCTTCHSPHGSSTLAEVAAVEEGEQRSLLVRHAASETFLRMSRGDSALCVACHGESPHEDAVEQLGIGGGAHPVGAELASSMEGRGDGAEPVGCLGCHAVHGAEGEHLVRGESDGKLCATCHADEADSAHSHPIDPDEATCRTCHDLTGGRGRALLRLSEEGGDVCVDCHEEIARSTAAGHSDVPGAEGIACLGCHAAHEAPLKDALLIALGPRTASDPLACLGCHGPGGRAAVLGISPGRLGHPVDGEVHEAGRDPLTCLTCHDHHGPRAEGLDCAECHIEQGDSAQRGGHGGTPCLACHPSHESPPRAQLAGVDPRSQTCLGCHLPPGVDGASPVASWSHPELVFRPDGTRWTALAGVPLYGPSGELLPEGQNGDLACSSCHLTHGPDPVEPGDHLRRPGWKEVCTSCHGAEALVLYRWFHQPDRRSAGGQSP